MTSLPYRPVSERLHDVAIFGAGYAGYAAARSLVAAGKSVLLIDRRAALVAESGWSFQLHSGDSNAPLWRQFQSELLQHEASANGRFDGGCTEVIANEWVNSERQRGLLQVLYYSTPLAVEAEGLLKVVLLGTKGGLKSVAAHQWIDATETGELSRLLVSGWTPPKPETRQINLVFRRQNWDDMPFDALDGALERLQLSWSDGFWPHERYLTITARDAETTARSWWIPALCALRTNFPDAMSGVILTHGSVESFDFYAPGKAPILPANVISAAPWLVENASESLLAGRFETGLRAAQEVLDAPMASADAEFNGTAEFSGTIDWQEEKSAIAVAGMGTGGALATLAAARQGGDVLGFDPLPFCGGIGAGGGIHWYYFGVKGGLQEELDERMRAVAPLFAERGQVHGFHPNAKKCVLENLLTEAGARLQFGATLIGVEREGRRVISALLATPKGAIRLSADAWIDSTGDGDVAARAGAGVRLGRDGDGLLHAYTQSSGRAGWKEEKPMLQVVNYDSGYTDPTDIEDLTRARIRGLTHYVQEQFTETEHPTYIAPAIGIRQSRQIDTDYVLELNDQIVRRRFPDSVGLAGCHFDNHAQDYDLESDEAMFLTWACRGLKALIGCEIPYRILLPESLDNVWLACRAIGVSQDAHHSLRMQRDMQRIGEVAGIAATLAPGGESRRVDMERLQTILRSSGALNHQDIPEDDFGPVTSSEELNDGTQEQIEACFESLKKGIDGLDIWHIYQAGQSDVAVRSQVLALLDSDDEPLAWRAASIAAMWNESAAESILLRRIQNRHQAIPESEATTNPWCPPFWFVSLSLLRRVISQQSLPVLEEVAQDELTHNGRTSLALCCEALTANQALIEDERTRVLSILSKLIDEDAPNSVAPPQHAPLQLVYKSPPHSPTERRPVREDLTWQIHLSVARARRALGLPLHQEALVYLQDERSLVRRAFILVAGIEIPVAL